MGYDDPEWDYALVLVGGVILMSIFLGGICLYHHRTADENQTGDYTRPIMGGLEFDFATLDRP
jgi:hypothetical protein